MKLNTAEKYEYENEEYLKYIHNYILQNIKTSKRDLVLDAASKTGLFAKRLLKAHSFKELTLNEQDKELISLSKERFELIEKIRHTSTHLSKLNSINNYFDLIIIIDFPQKHDETIFKELKRVLKPKGKIVITKTNKQQKSFLNKLFKQKQKVDFTQLTKGLQDAQLEIQKEEFLTHKDLEICFVEAKK